MVGSRRFIVTPLLLYPQQSRYGLNDQYMLSHGLAPLSVTQLYLEELMTPYCSIDAGGPERVPASQNTSIGHV